jgi:hypothetical protein
MEDVNGLSIYDGNNVAILTILTLNCIMSIIQLDIIGKGGDVILEF